MSKKFDLNTIKRLMKIITKKYKIQLIIVFILVILSSLANVSSSLFMEKLVDNYITPLLGIENPNFAPLIKALLTMCCIYLIGIISTYIYNRIMVVVGQGTLRNIRNDLFANMQKLPIRYFDTHLNGDIMSHYTNDIDTLRELISRGIPQTLSLAITVVSSFIAMLVTNIYLSALVIIMGILMILNTKRIAGKSSKYFMKQQETIGKVDGYIEEMISGQKVIKVFNYEEEAKKRFKEINTELYEDSKNANSYANILMPSLANLGNLLYVFIAIVGGILLVSGWGNITLGVIVAFVNLSKSFTMPIAQLSQQINLIIMAIAGAKRIFELMDEEPEVDNGYVTLVNAEIKGNEIKESKKYTGKWAWKHQHHDGRLEYVELKGHIELIDVDFGYEENKLVLHDVSVYAKPGQKIAFVGATGAGKTTITNLINRFYDIEDGKIRYDGININKIKKADLRRSLGMVLQDVNLFTGTIAENIAYGKDNATRKEIIEAAKLANADEFIKMLPKGYDTIVDGTGSNLSQGQKQLISIARAALNNPPVMILDEATSSIDTRTEKIVQDGMDKLMEGRTVFVIAHRLSTVRNSKAIIVLDHGRIIERGEHDYLIAQKGMYYQLYTGAFELE